MIKKIFVVIGFFALTLLSLSISVHTSAQRGAAQRAHVVILGTTDMHGRVFPIDYYTNKYDNVGITKVATLVKEARKTDPDLLLVDSGDTIQGTPLEYFHNKRNNTPPDPMMLAMNALHYDSMTVGNHEYNFGLKVLEKARSEAKFPWLSANTYNTGTSTTHYQPYIIKEVEGVRIGVLGLTTPGIPNWENVPNYAGLEFKETVSEAKKWVAILRDKEKVDLVLIAMHMGIEEDLRTGQINPSQVPNENAAIAAGEPVVADDQNEVLDAYSQAVIGAVDDVGPARVSIYVGGSAEAARGRAPTGLAHRPGLPRQGQQGRPDRHPLAVSGG